MKGIISFHENNFVSSISNAAGAACLEYNV